ncbi:hypothetical protein GCM10027080_08240 [Pedococcus soli]
MTHRHTTPAWTLAVGAMLSVQLGSALSLDVMDAIGPAGTAWLRLSIGAVIFIAIARPPLRTLGRNDIPWSWASASAPASRPSPSWPPSNGSHWERQSRSSSWGP